MKYYGETKIDYSFIDVLTGSDLSGRKLALMQAKSINHGPLVWLTGCVHGDEVGGIAIIQEVFRILKKEGLLKGSVYAFPMMNPIGFENATRNITPSEEDLNRSFPGDKNGALAERIAESIFSTIKTTNPTLVLDLHNDWTNSIPYTLIDPYPGKKHEAVYEKQKLFAKQTGYFIINEEEEGVGNKELKKSLTGSLLVYNIPSLTLEIGGAYIVDEKNVLLGVNSILNVLFHLEMIEARHFFNAYDFAKELKNQVLKYSHKPRCSTSGIIRFLEKPGAIVTKNQPVAKIYNVFGKLEETLLATHNSILLGHSDYSVALPGLEVLAFGIIK